MVKPIQTAELTQTTIESARAPRLVTKLARMGATVLNNSMTLRSERLAIEQATHQNTSSSNTADTRTVEQRINDYLDAPMNPDGTHPDPLGPEFDLFGP